MREWESRERWETGGGAAMEDEVKWTMGEEVVQGCEICCVLVEFKRTTVYVCP